MTWIFHVKNAGHNHSSSRDLQAHSLIRQEAMKSVGCTLIDAPTEQHATPTQILQSINNHDSQLPITCRDIHNWHAELR